MTVLAFQAFGRRMLVQLGRAVVVAFLVVVLSQVLIRVVPGDPAQTILGQRATPATLKALRDQLGLEQPLPSQIAHAVGGVVRGDLGSSLLDPTRSVAGIIGGALLPTMTILVGAIALSVLAGVPAGLVAGMTRRPAVAQLISGLSLTLLAVPSFFIALLLILFVSLRLGLAPAGGWGVGWGEHIASSWLPCIALACGLLPQVARVVQQAAREAVDEPYVEAAVSRGLSAARIRFAHVLPNCLLPLLALIGVNAAALLGGAVVVGSVFGLPGLGQELVYAVGSRNYPVIQGIALFSALFVVAVNLGADALYALVDPRVRSAT